MQYPDHGYLLLPYLNQSSTREVPVLLGTIMQVLKNLTVKNLRRYGHRFLLEEEQSTKYFARGTQHSACHARSALNTSGKEDYRVHYLKSEECPGCYRSRDHSRRPISWQRRWTQVADVRRHVEERFPAGLADHGTAGQGVQKRGGAHALYADPHNACRGQ